MTWTELYANYIYYGGALLVHLIFCLIFFGGNSKKITQILFPAAVIFIVDFILDYIGYKSAVLDVQPEILGTIYYSMLMLTIFFAAYVSLDLGDDDELELRDLEEDHLELKDLGDVTKVRTKDSEIRPNSEPKKR